MREGMGSPSVGAPVPVAVSGEIRERRGSLGKSCQPLDRVRRLYGCETVRNLDVRSQVQVDNPILRLQLRQVLVLAKPSRKRSTCSPAKPS
jgi:hypothetical protein